MIGVASSIERPAIVAIAMIGDSGAQLAAGVDVVQADPAKRRASLAGAWSQPPGVTDPMPSGAPTSPTGAARIGGAQQVGEIGPADIA